MCHLIKACLSLWWVVGACVWVGGVVCLCGLRFVVCGLWLVVGVWVGCVEVVGGGCACGWCVCVVCVSILNCT